MDLQNKKIIITGAASGIGKALLEIHSQDNNQIVAADINPTRLAETLDTLPYGKDRVHGFTCDLCQPEDIAALFDFSLHKMGAVNIFIACAGFAYYECLNKPSWEHIERIYKTNVFSTIFSFEKMREMNAGRDFRFVCIASAMAFMSLPGYTLYSSTKAALHRFAEGMRSELKNPKQLLIVYPIANPYKFFYNIRQQRPYPLAISVR